MKKPGITRRRFLAGSVAGGASLATAQYMSFDAWAKEQKPHQEVKVVPTLCSGCDNWCAIKVFVKGGRIWKAEGNPIAGGNRGRVCAKGHGWLHEAYNPDRIRSPLKRIGPNQFRKISWEHAYDEIGMRLKQIIRNHGPETVFWLTHPQGNVDLCKRFLTALGSPNFYTHGSTCFLPRNTGWWLTTGYPKPEHDYEQTRFVLFVGRNIASGMDLGQLHTLMVGRDRGARVVVIDPRFSELAAAANQWIAIRPGTDLALLLAIAHVMIKEQTHQKDFVANYTVGFEEFAEEVKKYTPEWAEEKTTVPKDTIVTLALEMAAAAPRAFIHRGYHGAMGTEYKNSLQLVRTVACVNGLLGNFNQVGGLFPPVKLKLGELDPSVFPAPPKVKAQRADGCGDPARYPLTATGIGLTQAIPELAMAGKLKAGFVYHSNPLRTCPNPARMIEGYKKLKLLVGFDYVLSETASICDYILPESFYLERDDVIHTHHSYKTKQVAIRQPVITPLYDTKPLVQIMRELAPRLGIGDYFKFTLEEYNKAALAPLGVSLEQLKKEGLIDLGSGWQPGEPKFPTESGKLEFVSSYMKMFNYPAVPAWEEPLVTPDPNDPHSFRLIHGKQAHHTHARTMNQPYLMRITTANDWGRAWIHPERAKKLGIKDGECMTLESSVGKGLIRAKVTEGVHPDCIFLPSGYGSFSRNFRYAKQKGQGGFGYGISFNDFLPTYFDPVLGHDMSCEIIVKVTKTFT